MCEWKNKPPPFIGCAKLVIDRNVGKFCLYKRRWLMFWNDTVLWSLIHCAHTKKSKETKYSQNVQSKSTSWKISLSWVKLHWALWLCIIFSNWKRKLFFFMSIVLKDKKSVWLRPLKFEKGIILEFECTFYLCFVNFF